MLPTMFRCAGLLLLFAVSVHAQPVHAQSVQAQSNPDDTAPTDTDNTAQAREWYSAGVDLYNRDEFGPALDAFRRAFALVPRPQLHFNMARCLSRLGQHEQAVVEFQQAIDSDELSDEERTRARAELLVEMRQLGTLEVEAPGDVAIDDTTCPMPCSRVLAPGTYEVRFGDETQTVTVSAEQTSRAHFDVEEPRVEVTPTQRGPYRPGVGTAIGVSLLAAGAAGTIGFGVRTRSLEDDFDRTPTDAIADDGEQSKLLTNLSIGVAVVGALIWIAEIIVGSVRERPALRDDAEANTSLRPTAW